MQHLILIQLILRKDGDIVYIENTFLNDISSGQTMAFKFDRYTPYPEYDTIEVSAQDW